MLHLNDLRVNIERGYKTELFINKIKGKIYEEHLRNKVNYSVFPKHVYRFLKFMS